MSVLLTHKLAGFLPALDQPWSRSSTAFPWYWNALPPS